MQGDWGELMLTHILQQSGLIENENYHLQVTRNADGSILKGENGESQRPDVVLHLPDGTLGRMKGEADHHPVGPGRIMGAQQIAGGT